MRGFLKMGQQTLASLQLTSLLEGEKICSLRMAFLSTNIVDQFVSWSLTNKMSVLLRGLVFLKFLSTSRYNVNMQLIIGLRWGIKLVRLQNSIVLRYCMYHYYLALFCLIIKVLFIFKYHSFHIFYSLVFWSILSIIVLL